MEYIYHILIVMCIYVIVTVSLDMVMGHGGLLSVSHAAFFGIGAYTSALISTRTGGLCLIGLLAGMTFAAVLSLLVSLPSLRLRGDAFVIATFGFQMILFSLFQNWSELTRGPMGISGIPQPLLFGWHVDSQLGYFVLTLALTCIAYLLVRMLTSSPFGRAVHSIREDERFVQVNGKGTLHFKVIIFAVGAAIAASAGSLFAHHLTYIDPTSFTVMESILMVAMVIVGGAGSNWGPLVGAMLLVGLPELLRFVGIPSAAAANIRQVLYGLALVACMLWRPQGLIGEYAFGREAQK